MGLRDYVDTIRYRWLTIIICSLVGLCGAFLYNRSTPRIYQADARSFVSVIPASAAGDSNAVYAASQFAMQRIKSYPELGDSNAVLEPVITLLHLPMSTSELASQVVVTNPADTVILDVAVTDSSPTQAAATANAVATSLGAYIEQQEATGPHHTSPVVVSLTSKATPDATPIAPRTSLDLALGLVAGLALGLAVAVVRQRLDTSLRNTREIEEITGTPPIGLLGKKFSGASRVGKVDERTLATGSQSLRGVRTNLALATTSPLRGVIVLSAPRSPVSIPFAVALASEIGATGSKVCLVEADAYRPRLAKSLALDGLHRSTEFLNGTCHLPSALDSLPERHFAALTTGAGPNPFPPPDSPAAQACLDDLARLFDVVLVITPPVIPTGDARLLARGATGVLLQCEYAATPAPQLSASIELVAAAGGTVLGAVLTGVPSRKLRREEYTPHRPTSARSADMPSEQSQDESAPTRTVGAPDRKTPGRHGSARLIGEGKRRLDDGSGGPQHSPDAGIEILSGPAGSLADRTRAASPARRAARRVRSEALLGASRRETPGDVSAID